MKEILTGTNPDFIFQSQSKQNIRLLTLRLKLKNHNKRSPKRKRKSSKGKQDRSYDRSIIQTKIKSPLLSEDYPPLKDVRCGKRIEFSLTKERRER